MITTSIQMKKATVLLAKKIEQLRATPFDWLLNSPVNCDVTLKQVFRVHTEVIPNKPYERCVTLRASVAYIPTETVLAEIIFYRGE